MKDGIAAKRSDGIVIALVPPKLSEDCGLTLILPEVLAIAPFIPSVVAPTDRFPLVSVSALFTLIFDNKLTPLLLLMINLSKVVAAEP